MTDDLAQYGALGVVAVTFIGLFATVLRSMLSTFQKQIERAGAVSDRQIETLTALTERLNGVHEAVETVSERVRDHHAFATAEARVVQAAHAELAADLRVLGAERHRATPVP